MSWRLETNGLAGYPGLHARYPTLHRGSLHLPDRLARSRDSRGVVRRCQHVCGGHPSGNRIDTCTVQFALVVFWSARPTRWQASRIDNPKDSKAQHASAQIQDHVRKLRVSRIVHVARGLRRGQSMAPTDLAKASPSDESVPQLILALERLAATARLDALAQLLGSLERLKAIAWGRLLATLVPAERPRTEPLEELRHLTPIQVAELLNLKEAYVHELCRSRKIPATKRGKYWIIPVAELRQWLGRARGIDPPRSGSLGLPHRLGTPAATSGNPDLPPVTPAGAPRRRRAPIRAFQQQAASTNTNASRTEGPRSP